MADPIRILHFADLHVGMENYGKLDAALGVSSRVRDFLDRLDEVIDYGLDHDADLAIFAGDAFKSRDPNPTQQREFARRIKRLADRVPTLLLVGNHDLPGMAQKANSVDIFRALNVPNVTVGNTCEGQVFQTRRGPVYVAWVPYPMRNRLLADEDHRGKSIEELELALRDAVASLVRARAEEALEHDMPRIFAGHFTVSGAKFGSERSVMLGHDVAVLLSTLVDPAWDYVALGHIHQYQNLNPKGYPAVVYPGSLERIDFGEEREDKGFCWVHATRGGTRYEFVKVRARPFVTVHVDVRGEAEPTAAVLAQLDGRDLAEAVVRVVVEMRQAQRSALRDREIEDALSTAYNVTVAKELEYEARARLGNIAPESLTPKQLLERYFADKGCPPERVAQLIEVAARILPDQ